MVMVMVIENAAENAARNVAVFNAQSPLVITMLIICMNNNTGLIGQIARLLDQLIVES